MYRKMLKTDHLLYFVIAVFIAFDFQYFVRHFIFQNDEKVIGEYKTFYENINCIVLEIV